MRTNIDIPFELKGSFERVVRRIPLDLRKDEELLKTIVDYLRLGGEKLARQAVEAANQTLELEVAERRKKAREEALIRAAEARLAVADEESNNTDDDFDNEDNDNNDDEDNEDEDNEDEDNEDENNEDNYGGDNYGEDNLKA